VQAKFLALSEKFKNFPLHKISWGIEWGCVQDLTTGKPLDWFVHHQLVPIHKDLQQVFKSREYKKIVRREIKSYKFAFDEEKYMTCMKKYNDQNLEKCI
jgi:hypothetical protein